MDLSGAGTFRLRVYHETESPIAVPCNVRLILRNRGDESTEIELERSVNEANKWVDYSFNFHHNDPIDQYNQVYIYFSTPDNENKAVGQAFYIDELTGPAVIVPEKEYHLTFRVKDAASDSPIPEVSFEVGQGKMLSDENGEVHYKLTGGFYSYMVSHPDYAVKQSSLDVQKDTLVEILLTPVEKTIRFNIYSDNMEKVLSNVTVSFGGMEALSGINGAAIFHAWKGDYSYTISHPDYFAVESSLSLSADTTILIILRANKASLKFRIYSDDKPLYQVTLKVGSDSSTSSQTGIAIFEELARFGEYDLERI